MLLSISSGSRLFTYGTTVVIGNLKVNQMNNSIFMNHYYLTGKK